jgi:hypothetical protein
VTINRTCEQLFVSIPVSFHYFGLHNMFWYYWYIVMSSRLFCVIWDGIVSPVSTSLGSDDSYMGVLKHKHLIP